MRSKMKLAAVDAAAARVASERAEQSMNNSPHTVTERLTSIATALDDVKGALCDVKNAQGEHGKDIRGLTVDVGVLRGADRSLRLELGDHAAVTASVARQAEETARLVAALLPEVERLTKTTAT